VLQPLSEQTFALSARHGHAQKILAALPHPIYDQSSQPVPLPSSMKLTKTTVYFVAAASLFAMSSSAQAAITNFNTWTQVTDPPHANFTGSIDTATQISLLATGGPIPSSTDIGYQSVNSNTAATSTVGFAFDPSGSFQVAVDFSLNFQNTPDGGLAIGFGIGEDRGGENSAGAIVFTQDGATSFLGAAARINDVNQAAQLVQLGGPAAGSLFAAYNAVSGDVTLGFGTVGAASPSSTATYTGIQNSWDNELLLASFFLRSDSFLGQAWTSGNATATFSNFRVLAGTPIAVPEPNALALFTLGSIGLVYRRNVLQRKP
jgi:hypothetical protein